jgi:CDP-glycerol glycerophosphotransferase (TagB/SpsB family)
MNILRESDAVLSIFSTMALEAAVLDRPILAIDFDGYARRPFKRSIRRFALFEHFKHVRATGAMPVARNFGELKELLQTTLQKPQELAPARERLRRELAGPLDGRAATRLVGALVSSIPFQKQSQP